MNLAELKSTASRLMAPDKGLIAMDESLSTINKRFEPLGIPLTEEYRRKYRELIVTTPNLGECISGAILFDETVHQSTADGKPFLDVLKEQGIVAGIKVDEGAVDMEGFPGEKITEGLDGLASRLADYYSKGLRFAKWRAVITIKENTPTAAAIKANAFNLARYASLCQQAGLVPIVEPEVLMDGNHTLQRCQEVTTEVLHAVFNALYEQRVAFEGMILKPNMVLPGADASVQDDVTKVADATTQCFLRCVPAAVPGIAFLSGGQEAELATERLNAMHVQYEQVLPWALTFSFSRALHQPALEKWAGDDANVKEAQDILYKRAYLNNLARRGEYTADLEKH
ncbi:fructose-bisphosphate aldolase class I [Mucilaginibacter sp. MD40]|uniref:class I fructose-bisphosphate aldolase n=1 Tax=Mucilaginibacter sp. MD40 TaxID=2029590 RepID=UPI000BACE950|nr:class I fructose-bisphosphate aldolase [Mucilaginibacter sp. MD40]PAW93664.1 fructose-bisphosphate aldolase class I [Mucilaginibacter sp. MD40]